MIKKSDTQIKIKKIENSNLPFISGGKGQCAIAYSEKLEKICNSVSWKVKHNRKTMMEVPIDEFAYKHLR